MLTLANNSIRAQRIVCLGTGVCAGYFIAVPSKAEIKAIKTGAQKALAIDWFGSVGLMGSGAGYAAALESLKEVPIA